MLVLVICLAVFCFALLMILGRQDEKNSALAAENGLLKGRMESIQEKMSATSSPSSDLSARLTVADIEAAVRHAGYVPDTSEDWVRFMVAGEKYYIDTARLPLLFVTRFYTVETSDWDMDLLKRAAHLLSDEMVMVKAIFDEKPNGTTLRFIIAAMDGNYSSLRDNLMSYINIVNDGNRRMREIYERLVEEKNNPAIALKNALTSNAQPESKLLS